jgi:two-component system, NarL family, invasion response regulator UvrY
MLRILIADDHEIVRQAIKRILLDEFPFAHIEESGDTETLITKAINAKWDIIITDMAMPGGGGMKALQNIIEKKPELPVLFFSAYPEEQYALRVIKAGAAGYLNKDSSTEELIKAIRKVLSGKKYIAPIIAEKLGLINEPADSPLHELLSERELNILLLLAAGQSISEIASGLALAGTTVSTYRSRILTKMKMRTNAELTVYAIENKLI